MFAVVILGIGFILLSAIFPVATQQMRATNDQAIAAHLARAAIQVIRSSTVSEDFPVTDGATKPFSDDVNLWNKVSGNVINAADARYAWIPFYSRIGSNGIVQITVLVVRRWSRDLYTAQDLNGDLHPRGVSIYNILPRGDGTAIAQVSKDPSDDPFGMYQSLADGCLLLMRSGENTGLAFRISKYLTEDASTITYVLVPGNGATVTSVSGSKVSAAVIGRDYADPSWDNTDVSSPTAGYTGPSQDIAVYTTFFSPN